MDKQSIIDKLERLGYMICDATNDDLVFAISEGCERAIDVKVALIYDDVNTRYSLFSRNNKGYFGICLYECDQFEDVCDIYANYDWYTFDNKGEKELLETFANQCEYTDIQTNIEQCNKLAYYRNIVHCMSDDELLCLYNSNGCLFGADAEMCISHKFTDTMSMIDEHIYIMAVVQIVPNEDLFDEQIEQALVQLNERIDNEHKAE